MIDFRSVRDQRSATFDFIQIRIASPRRSVAPGHQGARAAGDVRPPELVVLGRGDQARDHQLPLLQAGEGWPLLRAHLRSGEGLGMPLRQVQAHPLSRRDLRPLRRGSHAQPACGASAWGTSSSPCRWRTSGSSRRCRARWAICSTSRSVISRRSSITRTTSSSTRASQEVLPNQLLDEDEYLALREKAKSEKDTEFSRRHRRARGARAAQAARRGQRRAKSCARPCPTRARSTGRSRRSSGSR